jgi:hypothetical protein
MIHIAHYMLNFEADISSKLMKFCVNLETLEIIIILWCFYEVC